MPRIWDWTPCIGFAMAGVAAGAFGLMQDAQIAPARAHHRALLEWGPAAGLWGGIGLLAALSGLAGAAAARRPKPPERSIRLSQRDSGIFLGLLLGVPMASLLPITAHALVRDAALYGLRMDRQLLGVVVGSFFLAFAAVVMMARRTVTLDPVRKELRIDWGKPLPLWRRRWAFDRIDAIRITPHRTRSQRGFEVSVRGPSLTAKVLFRMTREADAETLARAAAAMAGWRRG